jgi:GNAT superfamily N-acetyltransferase
MNQPTLRILGASAAQGLAGTLARQAGVVLEGHFGPVDDMRERFLAEEACDVLVLTHAQVAELTAQGRVVPGSSIELGAVQEPAAVYVAAVASQAAQAGPAAAFVAQLGGDAARVTRQAAGFEGTTLRPAGPDAAGLASDAAAVRAVVRAVLLEMGLRRDADAADADLKDLGASYLSRGGGFDVAVDAAGSIVGCCGVYPMGDRRDTRLCELRKMYLLPAARRQGLGRRLLERALAFARGRGCVRMELETAASLKSAIALYRSAGFLPVPQRAATPRCDQVFALDLRK